MQTLTHTHSNNAGLSFSASLSLYISRVFYFKKQNNNSVRNFHRISHSVRTRHALREDAKKGRSAKQKALKA